jgi:hypothetical protein
VLGFGSIYATGERDGQVRICSRVDVSDLVVEIYPSDGSEPAQRVLQLVAGEPRGVGDAARAGDAEAGSAQRRDG